MQVALYTGSFDPITLGHLDIIKRAMQIFDKVIVAVFINKDKNFLFNIDERKELIKLALKEYDMQNIEVVSFNGLTADFAKQMNSNILIRGLRSLTDFEYELQMALTNKKLNPSLETIFLTTSSENIFLSSSIVKQIASFGGDITDFIPKSINEKVINKFKK